MASFQTGAISASGEVWYGNFVAFTKATATFTGSLTSLECTISNGITGTLRMAFYSDNAGAPGTLLATATPVVNPSPGLQTLAITGASVTNGTPYWVATINNNGSNVSYLQNTTTIASGSQAVGSQTFPSTAAYTSDTTVNMWFQANGTAGGGGTSNFFFGA